MAPDLLALIQLPAFVVTTHLDKCCTIVMGLGVENIISTIRIQLLSAERIYGLGSSVTLAIFVFPFIVVFFSCSFLLLLPTHRVTLLILKEKGLLDLLTFVSLITGGILGLRLVVNIVKYKSGLHELWFYLAFSIGLLITGMIEASGGKQDAGLVAPSIITDLNAQAQIVRNSFGTLEVFPLTFGLIGLVGVWISSIRHFSNIGSPYILFPWFVVIAFISAIDLSHDFSILFTHTG